MNDLFVSVPDLRCRVGEQISAKADRSQHLASASAATRGPFTTCTVAPGLTQVGTHAPVVCRRLPANGKGADHAVGLVRPFVDRARSGASAEALVRAGPWGR